MIVKDLSTQRFGSLLVMSRAGTKNNRVVWNCKCDCGNEVWVDTHSLTTGNTKSCGCQKYGKRATHGDAGNQKQSRLYRIWAGMKSRCNNPSHIGYVYYGKKGIKVCEEWSDYEPFKYWAMQNGYADNLTIDRIDNQKDYCPENCRWVTYKVQSNNTARNHYVTIDGVTHSISEWSDITGIPSRTIAARINVLGWEPQDAILTPLRGKRYE